MELKSTASIEAAADELRSARKEFRTIEPFSKRVDISEEWAYAVQQIDLQKRLADGEELVGMKLGLTSPVKQEQMNVNKPVIGFLTDSMLIDGPVYKRDYHQPRIEPELVFRTSQEINTAITIDQVPAYIDGTSVGFEIIDSRYPKFSFTYEDVVADNTSAAGFGVCEFLPLPADLESFIKLPGLIRENGGNERVGSLQDILGNPLRAIATLSDHIARQGLSLKAGSIILAGSMTDALIAALGSTFRVEITGLNALEVEVR